jgi:hypothetical protein
MGYYMRFFDRSDEPLTVAAIEAALKNVDPAYRLESPAAGRIPQADLYIGDGLYAEIEINQPGDGLFDDEVPEMLTFLEDADGENRGRVEDVLRGAKRIISVRVLSQGRESDETLTGIEPLLGWLFLTRDGLLQADGEGYYDKEGLILEESW